MVLLKFGRTPLFHSLLWVTFIVSMTEECKASTVKCENGSEVCLSFNVSSVNTPSIRRNNENLCSVFVQGTSPHVFGLSWSNKTINCSLSHSLSEMNLCFGNCQPEDGGNFSLHEDRTPAYPSVQILTLEIISQQYNLTGSSEFAALGESFTWTCEMFLPPGETIFAVYFHRNNIRTVLIGMKDAKCATQSAYSRYSYQCLSGNIFSLTIPAENMTVFEQKSTWRCEYLVNPFYRSPDVILNIAINVHNVSLIPSDDPLTVREGIQKVIQCVVNSDAVPTPTITWYLGSTNITSIEGTYTTSVIITGNRTDNTKTVQCRATNNNKPPKTASTTLNVEYPPTTNNLSQQAIIEGRILSVTCQATPGNPSSTIFYWTKVDNPGFKQNGATLQLYYIRRTSSGTYICTAENTYSNGEKGTDSQSIVVDVQYPQSVNAMSNQNILEGRDLSVNCTATPGNPSYTTFYWTKVDNPGFRQNGPTLQLPNIQRTSSGIYRCTAENDYSNGEKGTDSQSMVVNVLYSPVVNAMSQHNIMEGKNLSVTCQATPGNPSSTTFYWTKVDNSGFRQNGSNIQLYNIQRNNSGTYRCTAENSFSNGQKGTHSQYMVVNVQYSPTIENKSLQTVNESESATLTRNIVSNPLSNASWYDKTQLLKTESSVQTTTFTIENATCTDTKNYTLVASNGVGNMMTAMVELIVNCKFKNNVHIPRS